MNTVNFKDAIIRGAKTFVQAFIPAAAAVPILVAKGDLDGALLLLGAAGLAGSSALIAFIWNVLLDWSRS